MDHHVVTNIDAHMGNALHIGSHGLFKKHQITGHYFLTGNVRAQGVEALRSKTSGLKNAGLIEDPADKAGAVEAGLGTGTAVHIGIANVFFRLNHQIQEVRIKDQEHFRDRVLQQLIPGFHSVDLDIRLTGGSNHRHIHVFITHEVNRIVQDHESAVPVFLDHARKGFLLTRRFLRRNKSGQKNQSDNHCQHLLGSHDGIFFIHANHFLYLLIVGMENGALTLQGSAFGINSGHARRNENAVSNRNHSGWHSPAGIRNGSSCCCPHRYRNG